MKILVEDARDVRVGLPSSLSDWEKLMLHRQKYDYQLPEETIRPLAQYPYFIAWHLYRFLE
jgi:hypothetical protein